MSERIRCDYCGVLVGVERGVKYFHTIHCIKAAENPSTVLLETARMYSREVTRSHKRIEGMRLEVTDAQGRCAIIRHENNVLRRKVRALQDFEEKFKRVSSAFFELSGIAKKILQSVVDGMRADRLPELYLGDADRVRALASVAAYYGRNRPPVGEMVFVEDHEKLLAEVQRLRRIEAVAKEVCRHGVEESVRERVPLTALRIEALDEVLGGVADGE